MKTLYIEGLANHDGPESCVGDPQGRSEALIGVHAGWAIEPRNGLVRGADALAIGGRPHRGQRDRELPADPARSKNLCMREVSGCENREIPWPPVVVMAGRAVQGRPRPQA
jgi:hypothetical protein